MSVSVKQLCVAVYYEVVSMLSEAPEDSVSDYYAEFSQAEVEALKAVVRGDDVDGEEVRVAREALGIYD